MTPRPDPSRPDIPRPDAGSTLRLVIGGVLFVAGIALAVFGFLRLVLVLDRGGYGTTQMVVALVILGLSGATLSAGIATVIWDMAKRYEHD